MTSKQQYDPDVPFKVCPSCGKIWNTREKLLADPVVILAGYQVNFAAPELGLVMFNHEPETYACGTTFCIQATAFRDLYDGPVYEKRMYGTDECPGYCLHHNTLEACPNECECAWVREVIGIIRDYPKTG